MSARYVLQTVDKSHPSRLTIFVHKSGRQIGVDLTCIDWEITHPIHLSALDFSIPIRAFDQTHHEFTIAAPCQINQVIDHKWTTFLVTLHHKPETFKTF